MTTSTQTARIIIDELPTCGGYSPIPTQVLALCVALDTGKVTVGELSKALNVPVSTLNAWIEMAWSMGFANIRIGTRDRRTHVVSLTPKGLRLRRRRRGAK